MHPRLIHALRYVANAFAASSDDFRKHMGGPPAGADMILDGLRSHGLVNFSGGRVAASEAGLRALTREDAAK